MPQAGRQTRQQQRQRRNYLRRSRGHTGPKQLLQVLVAVRLMRVTGWVGMIVLNLSQHPAWAQAGLGQREPQTQTHQREAKFQHGLILPSLTVSFCFPFFFIKRKERRFKKVDVGLSLVLKFLCLGMTGFDGRGWFQIASRAAPNTR